MKNFYSILLLISFTLTFSTTAIAYPVAQIKNNTEYTVKGKVEYAACQSDSYNVKPGKTWKASSRGICLITSITGKLSGTPASLKSSGLSNAGEKRVVTTYKSTGTGFAKFQINAFGDRYRIFSLQEWENASNTGQGQSPGFRFVNHTPWPIAVSLDQVGCLFYGIVPAKFNGNAGELKRDTGAVWFTIRAHIQPDGINPQTDLDCAKPVAELVGDIAMGVLTGGSAAATKVALKTVVKEVIKTSAKEVAKFGANQLGQYLTQTGSVEMFGQYAGYDWPFKCDEMPEYHITGGPIPIVGQDNGISLGAEKPFKVKKVNSCGNDMMKASVKSASQPFLAPAAFLQGGIASKYQVALDCNHKDLKGEGTKGTITVALMQADGQSALQSINSPTCSGEGNLNFNFEISTPTVTSVNISTNSDNALFLDMMTISLNGIRLKRHGKDGGRGWCLSTDANDVNGSWKNYVSSCKSSHSYNL